MSEISKVCKVKYRGGDYRLYRFDCWDSGFSIIFLNGCTDIEYVYVNGYEMINYNETTVGWEDIDWWDRHLSGFRNVVYKFIPKCTCKTFDELIDTFDMDDDIDIESFRREFKLIEKYK